MVIDSALDLSMGVNRVSFCPLQAKSTTPRVFRERTKLKLDSVETHPSSFFVSSLSAGSISTLEGFLLVSIAAAIFCRRVSCSVDLA